VELFDDQSLVNFPVGFPGELPARFLDELPVRFLDELPAGFLLTSADRIFRCSFQPVAKMPPRKRVVRTQSASASREGGDENVPPPVPPIDQDALRQMVQDAAR
ncbi:unnamed protein product, partial [Brassica rapa subsp. trilocularis]